MKSFQPADIRNIVLMGHGFCGKTSIAEAILFNGGAHNRLGQAGTPTSTLDFEPEEHKRGGSVSTAFGWVEHEDKKINFIDTPGDGNFIFDSFAAMRGADVAVIVISAPDGIEVQTESVFQASSDMGLPRIIVVNKMDRERADHEAILADIEETMGVKPVPLQVPIGTEHDFKGVVSLLDMKALVYQTDGSGKFEVQDIPADLQDDVDAAWENLVECVAETDEELLEKYLDTFELSEEETKSAFRTALCSGDILPVFYTSATANVGIQPLMDLLLWAAPSPIEVAPRPMEDGEEIICATDQPFFAQVIRTFIDEFSGKMSIYRILSGNTPSDGQVRNTTKEENERLGSQYALRGNSREQVKEGVTGDILAVAKLKATRTNDTLSAPGESRRLVGVVYPPPMMDYTLSPTSQGDEDKLKTAIDRLIEEDSTLTTSYDELSNRLVLRGMGMAHLDLSVAKMKRKFKVEVDTALPAVPYRETIRKKVTHIEGKHKKQSGGAGQFGVCFLDVEPVPKGDGFEFVNKIFGGSIPKQYIPSVEKGVLARMKSGPLAGYPVVDLRVLLVDGKHHPVDSKDVAFQMAGSKGISAAMLAGGIKLMEPIYEMEIVVPGECMGDIMGDITSRRGRVLGMGTKGKKSVIHAACPLSEIQRYAPDLRSMSGGKGTYTMSFLGYEDVPQNMEAKIVSESPFRKDDDDD
ncbi:MAG: elongation factor G [Proteobacteria bacterium]|jgi:elongation factor G|nr:elongation factor G [Pseudomonadota bacterium]